MLSRVAAEGEDCKGKDCKAKDPRRVPAMLPTLHPGLQGPPAYTETFWLPPVSPPSPLRTAQSTAQSSVQSTAQSGVQSSVQRSAQRSGSSSGFARRLRSLASSLSLKRHASLQQCRRPQAADAAVDARPASVVGVMPPSWLPPLAPVPSR